MATIEEKTTASPRILTFDDIVSRADTPEGTVYVEEWGGAVRVRGLTKQQQHDIRQRSTLNGELDENLVQQNILVEGCIEPVIAMEQAGILWQKNAGAVDTVLAQILALSGMDTEAAKKAKAAFRP